MVLDHQSSLSFHAIKISRRLLRPSQKKTSRIGGIYRIGGPQDILTSLPLALVAGAAKGKGRVLPFLPDFYSFQDVFTAFRCGGER